MGLRDHKLDSVSMVIGIWSYFIWHDVGHILDSLLPSNSGSLLSSRVTIAFEWHSKINIHV